MAPIRRSMDFERLNRRQHPPRWDIVPARKAGCCHASVRSISEVLVVVDHGVQRVVPSTAEVVVDHESQYTDLQCGKAQNCMLVIERLKIMLNRNRDLP